MALTEDESRRFAEIADGLRRSDPHSVRASNRESSDGRWPQLMTFFAVVIAIVTGVVGIEFEQPQCCMIAWFAVLLAGALTALRRM